MLNRSVFSRARLLRPALFLSLCALLGPALGCGGKGNSTTAGTSKLKNRAFISNTYSGNLQIVDTQHDKTALTPQTLGSNGQLIPGQPIVVQVGSTVTLEVESADHSVTGVYDPATAIVSFITNSAETLATSVALGSSTGMILFSTDGNSVYAPEPNLAVNGGAPGGIQVVSRANSNITTTYNVPSARYIALSPSGQFLLVFAGNSDSLFLINLTASTVTPVEVPGFARPINAFFSSDSNTAYVMNCGPECGSSGAASVAKFDIPSQMITATVPVGGASVGLLNGQTLYVAGSPVPPGTTSTYDAVNVSDMTRITMNSVAIGDGFHTTMALATNNRLFIGANTCSNTVTGCLSVVDVTTNTAEPSLPPRGAVTSLLAVKNRNVMYAIEGGVMNIYDSSSNTLQPTQIMFTGALNSIVQVDP